MRLTQSIQIMNCEEAWHRELLAVILHCPEWSYSTDSLLFLGAAYMLACISQSSLGDPIEEKHKAASTDQRSSHELFLCTTLFLDYNNNNKTKQNRTKVCLFVFEKGVFSLHSLAHWIFPVSFEVVMSGTLWCLVKYSVVEVKYSVVYSSFLCFVSPEIRQFQDEFSRLVQSASTRARKGDRRSFKRFFKLHWQMRMI